MSQQPVRVVIAEDEALIRMDLAEMLAEEGYDAVSYTHLTLPTTPYV